MGSNNGDDMVNASIRGEKFSMDPLSIAVGNGMAKLRQRRRLITVGDGVTPEEMKTCGCEHGYIKDLQKIIDALIEENPDCRIGAVSNGAETLLYV